MQMAIALATAIYPVALVLAFALPFPACIAIRLLDERPENLCERGITARPSAQRSECVATARLLCMCPAEPSLVSPPCACRAMANPDHRDDPQWTQGTTAPRLLGMRFTESVPVNQP